MLTLFQKSVGITLGLVLLLLPVQAQDAKGAVNSFFSLLKGQKYAALYDYLPAEMQQKMSREQLTNSLKRLSSFITIEKMDIGRVQQKGDFAVVDTTIYGKLARPMKSNEGSTHKAPQEGKVAVQQYLFKENGHWKVATADSSARNYFLKKHPEFKQGFQFTQPRFFIKQDGQWKAMN
ncbi:MAG TPA: hypothetical protein VFZ34_18690 [Blastocatellia bacterium]|nr:hypothetical protein [Blastocatellia bacterium]